MTENAQRVYALASKKDNEVVAFGYGVVVGEKEIPKGRGFMGMDIEGRTNVCIKLDTGEEVFGHECWWGDVEKMEEQIKGCNITLITIDDYYKKAEA